MNYLNSYLRSKLDLSNIGFQRGEKWSNYFCTPVLSKVIGWAGVDGIHFCITKGFDEIIFAVSPENLPGEYVHPVARNFEDFLRLLLACYSNQTTGSELSTHMTMSSLHFEPAKKIEWRIVFQEIPNEDLMVSLI